MKRRSPAALAAPAPGTAAATPIDLDADEGDVRPAKRPRLLEVSSWPLAPPATETRLVIVGALKPAIDPRELQKRYTPNSNARNAHPRDARIRFDGSIDPATGERRHDYYLDGKRDGLASVTRCIERFWYPFDAVGVSRRIAGRGRYAGKSDVQIRADWTQTAVDGTAKHAQYEAFLQHTPEAETGTGPLQSPYRAPPGFYCALAAHPEWDVYRTEWIMYDEDGKVVGTADIVFINRHTGAIIVADWKNCAGGTLRTNPSGKNGAHPLTAMMPATKLNKYTIQLNMYRHILETRYGLTVEGIVLFNFPPDAPDVYDEIAIPRIDMAPFMALFPWRADDPRHAAQAVPAAQADAIAPAVQPPLVEAVSDADPRAAGPTRAHRIQRGVLPDGVVWMGWAYAPYGLAQSAWIPAGKRPHPRPTDADMARYEAELRGDATLLARVRDELYGKVLACWCRPGERCHAELYAKYANFLAATGWRAAAQAEKEEEKEKEKDMQ